MVDDEFSDSSTEGSVSVVTDVSAVHNDRASCGGGNIMHIKV